MCTFWLLANGMLWSQIACPHNKNYVTSSVINTLSPFFSLFIRIVLLAVKGTVEILETQKSVETKSSIVPQVKDFNYC